MGEGETVFSEWRDKVLKLLIDERVTGKATGEGELSARKIMESLGMTWDQYVQIADYLFEANYARCGGLGGLDTLMSVTTKGIEFYERRREALPLHIAGNVGAIFNAPAHGAQIQAVASAVHSSVQQVVEGAEVEDIRQAITQTIENMVRAVQQELTVEELAAYTRIASEFRQEAAKENPDKARLYRALPVLSFLGDVEGTIELAERAVTLANQVAPYLPLLITLLARLFSSP
jgi:hypothetical protein